MIERNIFLEDDILGDNIPVECGGVGSVPLLETRISKEDTLERFWIELGDMRSSISDEACTTKDLRINRKQRFHWEKNEKGGIATKDY